MPEREALLTRLLSRLRVEEREPLTQLEELLSRALFPDDLQQVKRSRFSFEAAELVAPENVPAELGQVINRLTQTEAEPSYRVALREVPLRSTQLHGSNPLWASGAAPETSLGPFMSLDGRRFWFDFFRIEKLVALYVQGVAEPALLFKLRTRFRFIGIDLPLAADAALGYHLNAGSIWINSRLLAANAPAGFFTGLTIRSGNIALSAAPQIINDRLTIATGTTVQVELQLAQQTVNDADPSSDYGKDARAADVRLPREFSFHFGGGTHAFDAVGDASWRVYGHQADFTWRQQQATTHDATLNRVLIPLTASANSFAVSENQSPFHTFNGEAKLAASFWALPAAPIDIANPTPAEGIGALAIRCETGLTSNWIALKDGPLNLGAPYIMAAPGRIAITDLTSGNALAQQTFALWMDKLNQFGTTAEVQFLSAAPFFFNTLANGTELISTLVNADVRADRPVTAKGEPLEIRSKKSLLLLAATKAFRLIYLFDDNMLIDATDVTKTPPQIPQPLSLVMNNALFKTTAVNGCLLFGTLAEDFIKVERGALFLSLGMHAYLPTLPDPYAANITHLMRQFYGESERVLGVTGLPRVWLLLIAQVTWEPLADKKDKVEVSFHFAPLPDQQPWPQTPPPNDLDFVALAGADANAGVEAQSHSQQALFKRAVWKPPDYGEIWDKSTIALQRDQFALLDVSTNADLLGVSFGTFGTERMAMLTTMLPAGGGFPLQVEGMDVVTRGMNARAFTVPQISWEPVINLTEPPPGIKDPPVGPNYYPDDGGPTRIMNNSAEQVALAPIPLSEFLIDRFDKRQNFAALSLGTLPYGMRALALLQKKYRYSGADRRGTNIGFNRKTWGSGVFGARQLRIDGGEALREGETDMFMGSTVQVNNILDWSGTPTATSTLGASVTEIFNNEFLLQPFQIIRQRGVPVARMDLSGYGASIFSNWLNPHAAIAETSQAKFDVFVGRCAHEIIQVKSILYPWAIKVVRTITLFRANSNYCYRFDSGWRAESDGRFDFTYYVYIDDPVNPGKLVPVPRDAPYSIHPGICGGLFDVKDIRETDEILPFIGKMEIPKGGEYVDENGKSVTNTTGAPISIDYHLAPVFFNADIEIENPVSGFAKKNLAGADRTVVASKHILGFVQLAPRGLPLTREAFRDLIARQGGTIGGPIDCVVNIAKSGQQMRFSSFDISNSFEQNGVDPAFAVAGRGSVLLPKDGSWGLVKHEFATGQVTPVPQDLAAPLIRIGKLVKKKLPLGIKPGSGFSYFTTVDPLPDQALLRIANPTELLRNPTSDTINYGFLQSTDTQKALFLTPAFQQSVQMLMSKTPPLFADAFRIVNSKAIFPNIGDAVTNFGDVISLLKNGNEFDPGTLNDAGKKALKIAKIHDLISDAQHAGYSLEKKVAQFDLPGTEWELIKLGDALRIYLEYKAQKQGAGSPTPGKLDFNIDSLTDTVADQWKSKMSNIAVVVDLGPIKRLMTIKGSWDSKKGSEAEYPEPQIEFAKELQPAMDILQILQDLQGDNYKDALKRGLKLAMSNKAGSWEYKFEASKEIPVLKFPMPPFDNDPNAPLKLEAGLKLGAYFNSALKVTTDPKDLLPSAGASLGFYGQLSVMCVSLSIATIYAVGQVTLDIAADSRVGPSLHLKFGFGAQIVVGLPIVGNVSVLYMVGVEMYTDSTQLNVSAFLLFQGHAELIAGLISITITIEAKGTVKRLTDAGLPGGGRTDLEAQVTFAIDVSLFLVIDIHFSTSWAEQRQIA